MYQIFTGGGISGASVVGGELISVTKLPMKKISADTVIGELYQLHRMNDSRCKGERCQNIIVLGYRSLSYSSIGTANIGNHDIIRTGFTCNVLRLTRRLQESDLRSLVQTILPVVSVATKGGVVL